MASEDAVVRREPYHFSGPVVLEIHGHVNFAGLLTSAHLVFILSFPPGKEIKTQSSAPNCLGAPGQAAGWPGFARRSTGVCELGSTGQR